MLALSAVVDEEPLGAGACNGAGGQRVEHGALLPDRAGVLRAARVVAALVGARQLRGAVGVHAALGVVSYHSCFEKEGSKEPGFKSQIRFSAYQILWNNTVSFC